MEYGNLLLIIAMNRAVYVGIDIIIIYFAIRLMGRLHDKSLKISLSVNSRPMHKARCNKSQVNIKLKLQVTGLRLHGTSLTSLRLSL